MSTAHCTLGAEVPIERMAGHVFLAKMGKRLLRPGGRKGTEQLYALADLRRDQRVCEIATNRAVSAVEMAERFGVCVDGVDASAEFLAQAEKNIADHHLESRIQVHRTKGDALPFGDGTFDAVTAEAVITMLPPAQKLATLREAARVLRPGGRLVIHELAWPEESSKALRQELVKVIQHAAWPLTDAEWRSLADDAGLQVDAFRTGPMSLMSPSGLFYDEGVRGVAKIAWNVLRIPGAKSRFNEMALFFRRHQREFHYVVLKAIKPIHN